MKRNYLLLLANYFYMAGVGLLSPVYALYVLDVGGNEFIAGASWSLYLLIAGLVMILSSKRQDRASSYKPYLFMGFLIAATSTFMYLTIDSIAELFLLQIIHALGIGILTPALRAAYTLMQDKKQKAHEWALFDGGLFILQGIAAFSGGTILALFGFTSLFIFMGSLQLVPLLLISKLKV